MKNLKILKILSIIGILLTFTYNNVLGQQKQHKHKNVQVFVDKDGDGYNDNAPDHDGDGIPNGLDPDWTKGRGRKMIYIDTDGDGINDMIQNINPNEPQNENMHQYDSDESIMNNSQEKHMTRKHGQHNN